MAEIPKESLIEQWANNIDVFKPVNGSWIEGIALKYGANTTKGDLLSNIATKLGATNKNGDLYHSIALKLGNGKPLNGSYLERIVQLTTPA
jgi:hypothetical protein